MHPQKFLGKHAQLLRSIVFHNCPRLPVPLSLPHLTDFELSTRIDQSTSGKDLLNLFSSAPRLRRIRILTRGPVVESPIDQDQVTLLEDLEVLELRSSSSPIYALAVMRLSRAKEITAGLLLRCEALRSLVDLPHGFGSLLAGTDKISQIDYHRSLYIHFDLPGLKIRTGDSCVPCHLGPL